MDTRNSVHLQNFPELIDFKIDEQLVNTMDKVRAICSCALSIRDKNNLRIRLPLKKIIIIGSHINDIEQFSNIILDEINVKSIEFNEDIETFSEKKLVLNFQKIGSKIGSKMPEVLKALKSNTWEISNNGNIRISDFELTKDEFNIKLEPKKDNIFPVEEQNILIMLDLEITRELEQEGAARDLVRLIQQFRKDANLDIASRIELFVRTDYKLLLEALEKHKQYIQKQTLATDLDIVYDKNNNYEFIFKGDIDKNSLTIGFNVIN